MPKHEKKTWDLRLEINLGEYSSHVLVTGNRLERVLGKSNAVVVDGVTIECDDRIVDVSEIKRV